MTAAIVFDESGNIANLDEVLSVLEIPLRRAKLVTRALIPAELNGVTVWILSLPIQLSHENKYYLIAKRSKDDIAVFEAYDLDNGRRVGQIFNDAPTYNGRVLLNSIYDAVAEVHFERK